jgi:hypothetical protein
MHHHCAFKACGKGTLRVGLGRLLILNSVV